jgi:tRNA nucleotidyltransferase (CCA-adding enzyme)
MEKCITSICDNGGEIYVVGGAVRNYIYNHFHKTSISIKDYDFLVRLIETDVLIKILNKYGVCKEVGKVFGIILFTDVTTKESYEFALPRTEISTGTGYRDFIVSPDPSLSLSDDFSRRDATMNSIGYRIYSVDDLNKLNKSTEEIDIEKFMDPFNGILDIKNKLWKCTGDPQKRFLEDPNRVMRAFRQSSELELAIEKDTMEFILKHYKSYVRLYEELFKILKCDNNTAKINLKIMNDIGILSFLGIDTNDTYIDMMHTGDIEKSILMKFAILIRPEYIKNIKEWLNDKQISAIEYLLFTNKI